MDVALMTCSEMPDLHPEDALLRTALDDLGLHNAPALWEHPLPPAQGYLMRTVWDYTAKPAQFAAWLKTLPAARTWNSPPLSSGHA